ncbi:ROK family protein [Thermosipho ferrireducens]|uniref:ROK family protein n=1 Tax=Thermosipho ferrireducens TaxID=2571116 RepID=A0ABX7S6G9_9BACT|nr:ROK family protein [Thermosipho ferrireducens]QTA37784.1 ROK family protein [Thermosipho ferrireducens]
MKLSNLKKILLNLAFRKSLYRNELGKELKVSPSTLTYLLNKLSSLKLIEIKSSETISMGRPKQIISLNPEKWNIIGIRIGREFINSTLFNGIFDVKEKISIRLTSSDMGNKRIGELLKQNLEKISKVPVNAVGLAFSGKVSFDTVNSHILKLENFNPKEIVKSVFPDSTVTILNDVEAIATEEFVLHGGQKILVINYGTGIGACFYESHGIYQKSERKVIDLGHFYAGGNEKCYCGRTGCFETVASDYAVLKKYKYRNLDIVHFILHQEDFEKDLEEIRHMYKYYRRKAEILYEETLNHLSVFLGNIVRLLEPDKVVICGEGTSPWFTQSLQKKIYAVSGLTLGIVHRGLENNIEYGSALDALREHILFTDL